MSGQELGEWSGAVSGQVQDVTCPATVCWISESTSSETGIDETSEETAALCAPRPLGAAPSWMACAAESSRRQATVNIALSGCVGSDEKRSSGFQRFIRLSNRARERAVGAVGAPRL